jgi:predicted esterase/predicted GNAT family acetyltransferase
MSHDAYHFAELTGPDYKSGNPVLFTFHGTGGDENQFLELGGQLFPEATIIAPRGDVSEHGALRFFRRTGEGVYDMQDLAKRTAALASFVKAHVNRLQPSIVAGLGYSNGANILASVMLGGPEIFTHLALMHPLIPWQLVTGDLLAGRRIVVTAGGRDPICPPEMTGQLLDGLEALGASVKSHWHPGGHEVAESEMRAISSFFSDIRASLANADDLPVEREEANGKGRYLLRGPGSAIAEVTYTRSGADTLIIDHTEVPDAFRGTGTGLRLLKALLADARAEKMKIIPICPFAAAQFERHPEWADVLKIRVKAGRGRQDPRP